MCGDGNPDTDICRWIRTGAYTWKKVSGMMGGRRKSRQLEGKVLYS